MCLIISQRIIDKIMNGPDEFYVYKFLFPSLNSPYQCYKYKKGWNKSRGRKEIKDNRLYGGALHVLLRKPRDLGEWTIVRFKAKKKDLVTAGFWGKKHSAGFKRLYLEKDPTSPKSSDS